MEDSTQSITSYDLHRMHYCWQTKQQCQQAAPDEQGQGTMNCFELCSFQAVPQDPHSNKLRPFKTPAQTLLCPPTDTHQSLQSHMHPSVPCTLQCTSVQSYCCCHSLPDEQVHKFTPCSASLFTSPCMWLQGLLVPTPHSLQQSAERGKGGGRKKEQVGTFFRGPVIFYLISQELLDYKSKVCQRKREDNKTQTRALHSSLHQEKSHPRAKPATFLGPLTLFRVFISLRALLWDS